MSERKRDEPRAAQSEPEPIRYEAVVGLTVPNAAGEIRIEPGHLVPERVIEDASWLVEQGLVRVREAG
jgi:hypothetical protein